MAVRLQHAERHRDQCLPRHQLPAIRGGDTGLDPHAATPPLDAAHRYSERELTAGGTELRRQEFHHRIVACGDVKQTIGLDGVLGALLDGKRGDADAMAICRVEAFDVVCGRRIRGRIAGDGGLIVGEAHIATGASLEPFHHVGDHVRRGLVHGRRPMAVDEREFRALELIGGQLRLADERPGHRRQPVDEFRAELDAHRRTAFFCRQMTREDAPADAVARFEQRHALSRLCELCGGGEARGARSHDDHVVIGSHMPV